MLTIVTKLSALIRGNSDSRPTTPTTPTPQTPVLVSPLLQKQPAVFFPRRTLDELENMATKSLSRRGSVESVYVAADGRPLDISLLR